MNSGSARPGERRCDLASLRWMRTEVDGAAIHKIVATLLSNHAA